MASKTRSVFPCEDSFPLKNRLGITTGDPQGIGQKIAFESLKSLGPQKNFQFIIWTSTTNASLKIPRFQTKVFKTAREALQAPFNEKILLEIKSKKWAGDWVEESANLCLEKKLSALITGPVSKATMKKNKRKSLSQTPLLKTLSGAKNVFMVFRGRFFNVILLTDHRPLRRVLVDKKKLVHLLKESLDLRSFLPPKDQKKPLGLLGLNPHAGENGLIGKEEQEILIPILKKYFSSKDIEGPLCPDAAFLKKNWRRYSFYIALYHDQGLIPFKAIHSHGGFAFSLGLPFLRLSVDHGTGVGLDDRAISFESFLAATKESLKLIKQRRKK